MAQNTSDVFVETIMSWGVDTVFGMPGDGINGVMEALRIRREKVRFIQVRHEESAAFMACAYAKYTGKLGCCLATSGPGAIHMLNGLYDAKLDQAPVLAILGQTFSDLKGSRFQQDVNLAQLFDDVSVYVQEVINPNQVAMLANEACRYALGHRGVSSIVLPIDYQIAPVDKKYSMHRPGEFTSATWVPAVAVPADEQILRAASVLNASQKPVMLVGAGALKAREEVIALAEKLGSPVVKSLLGKGVLPDEHPLTTGGLGLLGTRPSENVMHECDCLLMVGTSFPYMEFLPKPGTVKCIQIDDKEDRIGLRFPVDVGLVGDTKPTLAALTEHVDPKLDKSFLHKAQEHMKAWWKLMDEEGARDDTPIKPQRAALELSRLASPSAIVSGDSGTNTFWLARHFQMRGDQMFSCSGTLATMAPGLPYAIAAKVAFPERQSLAFVGDGGFTMLMGDFATAVKYGLDIKVVIVHNDTLGMIKWEQIVFMGNPEYMCELQSIDFAKFAEACGGVGITVKDPSEIAPAFERALTNGRPTVIDVYVDPNEPPMPAKATAHQAANFARALTKGTAGGPEIIRTVVKDKVKALR